MFYVARSLHLPACEPLAMYVVEVKEGVVTGWFPFDGERASMLWAETLFISHRDDAKFLSDITSEAALDETRVRPLFLYTLADDGGALCADTLLLKL